MWLALAVLCCFLRPLYFWGMTNSACPQNRIFCGPITLTCSSTHAHRKPAHLDTYIRKCMRDYAKKSLLVCHVSDTSNTYFVCWLHPQCCFSKNKIGCCLRGEIIIIIKRWESLAVLTHIDILIWWKQTLVFTLHLPLEWKKHSFPGKYILYDRHAILPSKCWLIIFNMQH